ncbi:MAG: hypothetical protein KAW12_00855 [Candidatus Aminicenantes bacterium]|nr:hypothetical protein [Candidatus Aminicenantes bacterium]
MKRNLILRSLVWVVIASLLLFTISCKKSGNVDDLIGAALQIIEFLAEGEDSGVEIRYKINLTLQETNGMGASVLNVQLNFFKDQDSIGTSTFDGNDAFSNSYIPANGTNSSKNLYVTDNRGVGSANKIDAIISYQDQDGNIKSVSGSVNLPELKKLPVINNFSVDKTVVSPGETTTLHWDVSNADTVMITRNGNTEIGEVNSIGSLEIDPTTSGQVYNNYKLTATNNDGEVFLEVQVRVNYPDVEYKITGTARRVDITYASAENSTSQKSNVRLPWSFTRSANTGDFLYLSAQNDTSHGSVTVSIYKDGKLYKTATSSGAYVIATVSGTY